jgi:hypothetical protein
VIPSKIDDLHMAPAHNGPLGTEPQWVLYDYLRAQGAFIAQLHARVKALEEIPAQLTKKS